MVVVLTTRARSFLMTDTRKADFIEEVVSPSSAPRQLDTKLGSNKDQKEVTKTRQEQSWKQFLNSGWKVFVNGSSTSKRAGANSPSIS